MLNPEQKKKVRELTAAGYNPPQIARELNLPLHSVRYAVKHPSERPAGRPEPDPSIKRAAIAAVAAGSSMAAVAAQYGKTPATIKRWCREGAPEETNPFLEMLNKA